ncbi:MAG: bifunctional sulfate adenylyltransferase/adenylylsulfate kinase [Pseudomonadota bacterium]
MENLIPPYGGELPIMLCDAYRAEALKREALDFPSIDLDWRQLCELELLLTGALAPLTGFMGSADMEAVLSRLQLADGRFWARPVMLAVSEKAAKGLTPGSRVALRDAEGFMPAILHVSEVWPVEPEQEEAWARASGYPYLEAAGSAGQVYLAGHVEGVALPPRHDFLTLRLTPAETRAQFAKRGWRRVLGVMPSQPMHRMHYEFFLRSAVQREANLLIQVAGGADPVHDAAHFSRIRACQALQPRFPAPTTLLTISPLMTLPEGDREVLHKALIARNHGCTQLVVGGEWVGSGELRRGGDMAAVRSLAREHLGLELVPFPRLVYVEDRDEFMSEDEVPEGSRVLRMNGAELHRRMMQGSRVPEWYSYPEVLTELAKAYPPRSRQGFTVFCTGLSGAGKSTIARALTVKLMEMGGRRVTLLDGDVVRRNLSSELGFSKEHRDINIRRIGYVASEITKHGGIAICAPIAPYRQTRRAVRDMIEPWGGFIEVHVSTAIEVCEGRDRKGLYAKARAGLIPEFTGVSDPYEVPEAPELVIDTAQYSVEEAVARIVLKLEHEGYLR